MRKLIIQKSKGLSNNQRIKKDHWQESKPCFSNVYKRRIKKPKKNIKILKDVWTNYQAKNLYFSKLNTQITVRKAIEKKKQYEKNRMTKSFQKVLVNEKTSPKENLLLQILLNNSLKLISLWQKAMVYQLKLFSYINKYKTSHAEKVVIVNEKKWNCCLWWEMFKVCKKMF